MHACIHTHFDLCSLLCLWPLVQVGWQDRRHNLPFAGNCKIQSPHRWPQCYQAPCPKPLCLLAFSSPTSGWVLWWLLGTPHLPTLFHSHTGPEHIYINTVLSESPSNQRVDSPHPNQSWRSGDLRWERRHWWPSLCLSFSSLCVSLPLFFFLPIWFALSLCSVSHSLSTFTQMMINTKL